MCLNTTLLTDNFLLARAIITGDIRLRW